MHFLLNHLHVPYSFNELCFKDSSAVLSVKLCIMKIMRIAQGSVCENEVAQLVICFIYFKEQPEGGT